MIYKKDKQPLVGKLKGRNHWVLGALGSRGFLWAPFLAEKLSESILENKEYSGPFSMERIGLV